MSTRFQRASDVVEDIRGSVMELYRKNWHKPNVGASVHEIDISDKKYV